MSKVRSDKRRTNKGIPIRLNIGAGASVLPGFTPIDIRGGHDATRLKYGDGSVDEIRAVHVLEHFPTKDTEAVLREWIRVLKPGGLIRVAVPDFAAIARNYIGGERVTTTGYVMGGQADAYDFHHAIFDDSYLRHILIANGIVGVHRWESDIEDCAALPISLNLAGWKRRTPERCDTKGVIAVMSVPRFGLMSMIRSGIKGFSLNGINWVMGEGVFWHQALEMVIEDQIKLGHEYILTADYDSKFTQADVRELVSLIKEHPEADAIISVQARRGANDPLFWMRDEKGEIRTSLQAGEFFGELTKVALGHFGLTIFRAAKFAKVKKPWLWAKPSPKGDWGEGHVDADMVFWVQWGEAGNSIYMANRVVIGHIEEMCAYPDLVFNPVHVRCEAVENAHPWQVMR